MFRVVSRYALRTKTVYVSAALAQLLWFFHRISNFNETALILHLSEVHVRFHGGKCASPQRNRLHFQTKGVSAIHQILIFIVLLSGKPVKPIVASHAKIALKIFCHTWHTVLYQHLVTLYLILVQFIIDRFAKSTLQTTRH